MQCFKIMLACLFILFTLSAVCADGGLVPPRNSISVSEPGQKAIIGWNGSEQILILSTNVLTSTETWVVEIVPFPSLPASPAAGSFDSFLKIQEIINSRVKSSTGDVNSDGRINIVDALMIAQYNVGMQPAPFNVFAADVSGDNKINIVDALKIAQYAVGLNALLTPGKDNTVDILFNDLIGVHDITGVRAASAASLVTAASTLLSAKTSASEMDFSLMEPIIADYINRGIEYFVMDLLNLGEAELSRQPIIYRFTSDTLFFPLKISATGSGSTDISVFTVTSGKLDADAIAASDLDLTLYDTYFDLSAAELEAISPGIADLFGGKGALLARLRYKGLLSSLANDLKAGLAIQ